MVYDNCPACRLTMFDVMCDQLSTETYFGQMWRYAFHAEMTEQQILGVCNLYLPPEKGPLAKVVNDIHNMMVQSIERNMEQHQIQDNNTAESGIPDINDDFSMKTEHCNLSLDKDFHNNDLEVPVEVALGLHTEERFPM